MILCLRQVCWFPASTRSTKHQTIGHRVYNRFLLHILTRGCCQGAPSKVICVYINSNYIHVLNTEMI